MIPLTNHDFQWGRCEVVIIYPYIYIHYILLYYIRPAGMQVAGARTSTIIGGGNQLETYQNNIAMEHHHFK